MVMSDSNASSAKVSAARILLLLVPSIWLLSFVAWLSLPHHRKPSVPVITVSANGVTRLYGFRLPNRTIRDAAFKAIVHLSSKPVSVDVGSRYLDTLNALMKAGTNWDITVHLQTTGRHPSSHFEPRLAEQIELAGFRAAGLFGQGSRRGWRGRR